MPRYEYKVIPAPARGEKARGLKTTADRFAHALELALNPLGAEGWEFTGAETLPVEERSGFAGRVTTVFQNVLVFRREIVPDDALLPEEMARTPAQKSLLSFGRLRLGKGAPKEPPLTAPPAAGAEDRAAVPRLGPAVPADEPEVLPPFRGGTGGR